MLICSMHMFLSALSGLLLRVVAWGMLSVCERVVCIGVVLHIGTCIPAPIFTCADIAHTGDGPGIGSTSPG